MNCAQFSREACDAKRSRPGKEAAKMEDYQDRTYIDKYGVKITIDWSLVRSMSEEERQQRKAAFNRLAQEMRIKYARKAAMQAQG